MIVGKGQVSQHLVVRAVQYGIERAARSYPVMSGGDLARDAPEYFFVTEIASRLRTRTKKKCYVILERTLRKILKAAGAIQKGVPKKKIGIDGRADILVQFKDGRPRAVIEVKHPLTTVRTTTINPDIERICTALLHARNTNSLRFGIFAFYYSKPAWAYGEKDTISSLKDKVTKIAQHVEKLARSNGCRSKLAMKTHGKTKNTPFVWAAICIVLSRLQATSA